MNEILSAINSDKIKESEHIFAEKLGIEQCLWIFFIGSFLGVILEVIFYFLTTGNIQSRTALVHLPLNPVYGAGAVGLTVGLYDIRNSSYAKIFVRGFIIGGVIEYLASWIQQVMIGSISWNYSAQILNVGGRTSLKYMIYWGLLAIVWIKYLYPFLVQIIQKIPYRFGKMITSILFTIVLIDCIFSVVAVKRWNQRLDNIPSTSQTDSYIDKKFNNEKMKEIYPNMVFDF